jgi:cytoskeletal protein RodZ
MGIRRKKTLIDQAAEFAESILPQIESAVDSAREKAGPAIADARAKAKPLLAEGKALAAEKAASGRTAAGETLAAFAEHAHSSDEADAADDTESTGKRRKGGKLKKLIVLGGLAALAGFVAKKLLADSSGGNWQQSYTPTPPPAPRSTSGSAATATATPYDAPATDTSAYDEIAPEPPEVTAAYDDEVVAEAVEASDDAAAASPDEALADATNGPHEVTTPDAPAEVIPVDTGDAGYSAEAPAPAPATTSSRRSRGLAGVELGEDAAAPLPDGSAPEGFAIKGNQDSGKYHTPASRWYVQTVAEVWFRTEEAAEKAGFVKAG